MSSYRIREVKIIDLPNGAEQLKPLREYERDADDEHAIAEQVRHFFEVEMLSLKAPQTIDFDAVIVIDPSGREVARFNVSDVWKREAEAVNSGEFYAHWA